MTPEEKRMLLVCAQVMLGLEESQAASVLDTMEGRSTAEATSGLLSMVEDYKGERYCRYSNGVHSVTWDLETGDVSVGLSPVFFSQN